MNKDHLSVQAIAAACGSPYTLVRRYAEAAGMAELMGGVAVKGALGLRYPPASLPRWQRIMELHQARAITPVTAAQALPIIWGLPTGAEPPGSPPVGAQAADTPGDPWGTLEGPLERIAEALERLADAVERAMEEETKATKWRRPRSR